MLTLLWDHGASVPNIEACGRCFPACSPQPVASTTCAVGNSNHTGTCGVGTGTSIPNSNYQSYRTTGRLGHTNSRGAVPKTPP
jgi:hypothetical protein